MKKIENLDKGKYFVQFTSNTIYIIIEERRFHAAAVKAARELYAEYNRQVIVLQMHKIIDTSDFPIIITTVED